MRETFNLNHKGIKLQWVYKERKGTRQLFCLFCSACIVTINSEACKDTGWCEKAFLAGIQMHKKDGCISQHDCFQEIKTNRGQFTK